MTGLDFLNFPHTSRFLSYVILIHAIAIIHQLRVIGRT